MSDDKDRLRRQDFSDIIERDIREQVGARSVSALKQVAQTAFESAGDRGKRLEWAVYIELRRRVLQISYWRDKGEIDFVVNTGQGFTPRTGQP